MRGEASKKLASSPPNANNSASALDADANSESLREQAHSGLPHPKNSGHPELGEAWPAPAPLYGIDSP
jgi:hypothetical protein